jgi:hypothetical protein
MPQCSPGNNLGHRSRFNWNRKAAEELISGRFLSGLKQTKSRLSALYISPICAATRTRHRRTIQCAPAINEFLFRSPTTWASFVCSPATLEEKLPLLLLIQIFENFSSVDQGFFYVFILVL